MYIRCKKFPNSSRRVLAICHSVRTGSKVSQKTIKYIGSAHNDEQYAILLEVAQNELKALQNPLSNQKQTTSAHDACNGVRLVDVKEEHRIIEGFHDICGAILDRLGINDCLTNYRYQQLQDVVLARIACPTSKLKTAQILNVNFSKPTTENRIYRLMDDLITHEEAIKVKIFEFSKSLCPNQIIDLFLFDVTTLYFESQKADEIRDFGYGKDGKIGEVQVVLALATTSTGLPIGYHLFSGKTAEVNTLLECLKVWRKVFAIEQIVVVADRAMMSDANLLAMEEAKIDYIVAAKLKSLPKKLQQQILDRKQEVNVNIKDELQLVQEQEYKSRRLVIGFSDSRAKKDKTDRERLLAKLKNKLGKGNAIDTKKLVTNRGYLKFADEKQKGRIILNEERIAKDALWDGLHGVITSNRQATQEEILTRYKRLWIIEESFRINKHTLAMRPIYHF